ncbi:MAG: hypothetical protein CMJ95_03540 [Planctomycetes bacterium]|nr:hypothetical protein [Planctomycetota bacterium]
MQSNIVFVTLLAIVLLPGSIAFGQTFEISSTDQTVPAAGGTASFTATVSIEQVTGALEETKGFSFAYRHDPALLEVVGSNPYAPNVVGDLAALNNNDGPDFIQGEIFGDGFTIGVIYGFTDQTQVITFEVAKPMIEVEYSTLAGALDGVTEDVVTDIVQGNDLGTPPTSTVVVIGAGVSAPADALPFTITIEPAPPAPPIVFTISCGDQEASFSSATGVGSFTNSVSIVEDVAPGGEANETQGFSCGVGHDSAVVTATAVQQGPVLQAMNGGSGAEYFQPGIEPDGCTVGCIYDFAGIDIATFGVATEVLSIDYDTVAGALAGSAPGSSQTTNLTPVAGLGPNAVTLVIVVGGQSVSMQSQAGVVTLVATGGFNRGDCNDDGNYDIADAITLLDNLFLDGEVFCDDACDGNDDELKDIADAVFVLSSLFVNGPMPPGNGTCAPDPTEGTLGCEVFNSCL